MISFNIKDPIYIYHLLIQKVGYKKWQVQNTNVNDLVYIISRVVAMPALLLGWDGWFWWDDAIRLSS